MEVEAEYFTEYKWEKTGRSIIDIVYFAMSNSTELLRGHKIIIIGGSSGIGRSVAAASLAHGASVVIASSSSDKVNSAVT